MDKLAERIFFAAVALVTLLPLSAAAELRAAATCADPSWNALMSGECGIGDLHIVRPPRQDGTDSATQLVVGGPDLLVPEPETYALMLVGLVAVVAVARRSRRD